MSLMGDILQLIEEDATKRGINKINNVELIVGEISNTLPDALQMAFDIFRDQNLHLFAANAQLTIHLEEAKAECVICGLEYHPTQKIALCPNCRVPSGKVLSGETFQILSYDGGNE